MSNSSTIPQLTPDRAPPRAYRMADGTQALDESAAYFVILDEDRIDELTKLLLDFKAGTLQEAIYLEIQRDVDVRFLR
jgi:hypothetical protein